VENFSPLWKALFAMKGEMGANNSSAKGSEICGSTRCWRRPIGKSVENIPVFSWKARCRNCVFIVVLQVETAPNLG
jgi:hypothetical protein